LTKRRLHLFDQVLSVREEDLEILLRGYCPVPWSDFLLNPRRLRGSDFLMRWSQGVWSEQRLRQAVNATNDFFALPYGPSGVAPTDIREFELYFERLEKAGLGKVKRPDLLIFRETDAKTVHGFVAKIGGLGELPFTSEDDSGMRHLISHAILAIECENSLWIARQMPEYGQDLAPQKWLNGRPGLKKSAVVPTVIIKEEDREPLYQWQQSNGKAIHVWHVFYDMAFGLPLDRLDSLVAEGLIRPTEQVFQAPGGPTTKKTIYKVYYQYAYPLASATEQPKLIADQITDKNGHILPYVRFEGGRLEMNSEGLSILRQIDLAGLQS
jgi:hypothetical protein